MSDAGEMWVLTQGLLGGQPLGQLHSRVMVWVVRGGPEPTRGEPPCRAQAEALPSALGTCDPDPLHALCALRRTWRGSGLGSATAGKGSRAPGIQMSSCFHWRERVEARDILGAPSGEAKSRLSADAGVGIIQIFFAQREGRRPGTGMGSATSGQHSYQAQTLYSAHSLNGLLKGLLP